MPRTFRTRATRKTDDLVNNDSLREDDYSRYRRRKWKAAVSLRRTRPISVTTTTGMPRTTDIHRRNTLQNNSTPDERRTPEMGLSAATTYKFFARWYTWWVSTMDKQRLLKDQFLRRDFKIRDNKMVLTLRFYFFQNRLIHPTTICTCEVGK